MIARNASFALALALCACSSGAPPPASLGVLQTTTSVARSVHVSHPDRGPSWISPALKRAATTLLFVSDTGTAEVYIYSFPALKLVGKVTGFVQPQGLCSDAKGNVWITDTSAQMIYEVSHHGRLENELADKGGNPVGCASDPKTGNLAVMNLFGSGSTSGNVLVFGKGVGSGMSYQNPSQFYYNFGGYDQSGNLFFDGRDASGNFMLSELPSGSSSAKTVPISGGTIYFPGMVQWDPAGRDLVVGDQSCGNVYTSCVYTVSISRNGGTIKKQVPLENGAGGAACDVVQAALFNGKLAGSDFDFCGSAASATYVWPYPAGGAPLDQNQSSDQEPIGAAVSK